MHGLVGKALGSRSGDLGLWTTLDFPSGWNLDCSGGSLIEYHLYGGNPWTVPKTTHWFSGAICVKLNDVIFCPGSYTLINKHLESALIKIWLTLGHILVPRSEWQPLTYQISRFSAFAEEVRDGFWSSRSSPWWRKHSLFSWRGSTTIETTQEAVTQLNHTQRLIDNSHDVLPCNHTSLPTQSVCIINITCWCQVIVKPSEIGSILCQFTEIMNQHTV